MMWTTVQEAGWHLTTSCSRSCGPSEHGQAPGGQICQRCNNCKWPCMSLSQRIYQAWPSLRGIHSIGHPPYCATIATRASLHQKTSGAQETDVADRARVFWQSDSRNGVPGSAGIAVLARLNVNHTSWKSIVVLIMIN